MIKVYKLGSEFEHNGRWVDSRTIFPHDLERYTSLGWNPDIDEVSPIKERRPYYVHPNPIKKRKTPRKPRNVDQAPNPE